MRVNFLQPIEDHEDYPVNRTRAPSDSDDNSGNLEFLSGSFSADSDQYVFFSSEDNFDSSPPHPQDAPVNEPESLIPQDVQEGVNMVHQSPGRRFDLSSDP